MKFIKILSAFFLFTTIFYLPASAQSDTSVLTQIMVKTAKAYQSVPVEKVYLHFDKPYYAIGDTIWFKAYVTVDNHVPSPISKIVYVDVVSAHDTVVRSIMLPVKNSVAWGSIILLPTVFKKGNYRVVAYTHYMNNNGTDYFFNRNIAVGDAVGDNISANVSLKSDLTGRAPKITAGVTYSDNNGDSFGGKKVNWIVKKDDETIAKGKGETDKNGFVEINFYNVKKVSLDSAHLLTELDNGQGQRSQNSFSLDGVAKPNDIQFFPEGGLLIGGLRTKIAFKAIKPDGRGIDAKGTITDNNNKVVAEFSSSHLGMGVFILTPDINKTYTAHVTYADGTTVTADFPKVGSDGIDLGLENSDPNLLNVKLQCDSAFMKDFRGKTFYLLAKSSGVICYAAKFPLEQLVYNASIPKSKFPTGIVQVTLFTYDGEPVSERVAFIQHNDDLNLTIGSNQTTYDTRQLVKLNVSAKHGGQPVEGNFSVSVIDENKVPYDENKERTILTYLLLTSDIQGFIEEPNYYFNHPTAKTAADLDILMQTQGYRRFSYDRILDGKMPVLQALPERGIEITGTLRHSNGIPVNRGNVHLSIPDKYFYKDTVTDAEGRFRFANLVIPDSSKVILSARNNYGASDLMLTVDNHPMQRIPVKNGDPARITNIDSVLSAYLKNSKKQYNRPHMLREVVIKDKKIEKLPSHLDYPGLESLSTIPDHLIKGSQLQGCNSLLECLKALAMGMTFQDDNFYVFRDYSAGKRIPVQVFLRGVPVDANYLASIDPNTVESVEIFLKDDLGLVNSTYNTDGAIVINTKKAPEGKKISFQELKQIIGSKNEVSFYPQGYEAVRTFYMPRYNVPRDQQPTTPDLRTTIYWNPNVRTDKNGNATLEFYNADGSGIYKVTIEGFDKDGDLGRKVYHYTVQ